MTFEYFFDWIVKAYLFIQQLQLIVAESIQMILNAFYLHVPCRCFPRKHLEEFEALDLLFEDIYLFNKLFYVD